VKPTDHLEDQPMGCDMVVALARATVDGQALFGHNSTRAAGEVQALVRRPGRDFAPGEMVRIPGLALPQVRRTATVLANRCENLWGYPHGINEHGVALGVTSMRMKLSAEGPRLSGPDLVRLTLERAGSARQAVDVIADLVTRHGQGTEKGEANSFLIVDRQEAFALETCGAHWAEQSVREVRAASDVCHLRQDWDRISRGLASLAIERGWWPEDGSKLDFAGALAHEGGDNAAALRRWGRATVLLEQQNGQIDVVFLRRLLGDHVEVPRALAGVARTPEPSLCRHAAEPDEPATAASLVAQLGSPACPPVAWCAFGAPCSTIFFPLFLNAELPTAFEVEEGNSGCRVWHQMQRMIDACQHDPERSTSLREALAGLQERFDLETQSLLSEATALAEEDAIPAMQRLASSLMQHNLERFEDLYARFFEEARQPAVDESLVFAG
jgi:secernin